MALPIKKQHWTILIAVSVITAGVLLRLLPHEPNFAPVGAIALFGGAILGWRHGVWLPLGILMISDVLLGLYDSIVFTWMGFVAVALFGALLGRRNAVWKIGIGSLGAALLFFAISNFGTWLTSGMYSHTWAGLVDCYVMALPFLRMTLLGDLFYAATLFGAFYAAVYASQRYADARSLPVSRS